ncbi:hypothetical protein DB346_18155 [Verrucomicrobia bacterium LW23]|nr:hypothetical protein DB346_18155 [Verrucomicrobia bacterium LW23]
MLFALPQVSLAATFEITPKDKPIETADFRCVLPDSVTKVRGVLVLVPGAFGDGRNMATERDWQALAEKHQLAIVACSMKNKEKDWSYQTAANAGKAILSAIKEFAVLSKHPEIENAPLAFWGHSAGGQVAYNFTLAHPRRVAAFTVNKGATYEGGSPSNDMLKVPGIFFLGSKDSKERVDNITNIYEGGRRRGAVWCLVVEKDEGHGVGVSKRMGYQFLDNALAARLPGGTPGGGSSTPAAGSSPLSDFPDLNTGGRGPVSGGGPEVKLNDLPEKDGFIGNLKTGEVTPGANGGSRTGTSWLLNKDFATAWSDFVKK